MTKIKYLLYASPRLVKYTDLTVSSSSISTISQGDGSANTDDPKQQPEPQLVFRHPSTALEPSETPFILDCHVVLPKAALYLGEVSRYIYFNVYLQGSHYNMGLEF